MTSTSSTGPRRPAPSGDAAQEPTAVAKALFDDDTGTMPPLIDDRGFIVPGELTRRVELLNDKLPEDDATWTRASEHFKSFNFTFAGLRAHLHKLMPEPVPIKSWSVLLPILLAIVPDSLDHLLRGWPEEPQDLLRALTFFESGAAHIPHLATDWDYVRARKRPRPAAHPIASARTTEVVLATPARAILQESIARGQAAAAAAEQAMAAARSAEARANHATEQLAQRQLRFEESVEDMAGGLQQRLQEQERVIAALRQAAATLPATSDHHLQPAIRAAEDELRRLRDATDARFSSYAAEASAYNTHLSSELAAQRATLAELSGRAADAQWLRAEMDTQRAALSELDRRTANVGRSEHSHGVLERRIQGLEARFGEVEALRAAVAATPSKYAHDLSRMLADAEAKLHAILEQERRTSPTDFNGAPRRQNPQGHLPHRPTLIDESDDDERSAAPGPAEARPKHSRAPIPPAQIDRPEFYLRGRNCLAFWAAHGIGTSEIRTELFKVYFNKFVTERLTGSDVGHAADAMRTAIDLCGDYAAGVLSERAATSFSEQVGFLTAKAQYGGRQAVLISSMQRQDLLDPEYRVLVQAAGRIARDGNDLGCSAVEKKYWRNELARPRDADPHNYKSSSASHPNDVRGAPASRAPSPHPSQHGAPPAGRGRGRAAQGRGRGGRGRTPTS